jgi:hypothetical protein
MHGFDKSRTKPECWLQGKGNMQISNRIKKSAATLAATTALTAGIIAGVTSPASASTIQNNWIQLCAQGNYPVQLQFPYRGGFRSFVVNPHTCNWWYEGTISWNGGWEPVQVIDDWSGAQIGRTYWYNGNVSGIGFGAGGCEGCGNQWLNVW